MILQTILIVLHVGPHHRELKYFMNQGERDLTGRFFKFLSPPGLRQDSGSHLGRMSRSHTVVTVCVKCGTCSPSLELLGLNQAQKQEQ